MIRHTLASAAALAATLLCIPPALAQQDSLTITDGSATFTLDNLRASRTGNLGGRGTFTTGSPTTNQMFQNWFWIRAGSDTREYALSNQTVSNTFANTAFLQYDEPANNGAVPNALRITLEYTLHDLSTASGRTDDALLIIAWRITNRTAATLDFPTLFHYLDCDAGGTSAADSAVFRGVDSQIQVITDAGGPSALPARIEYACSSQFLQGREVGTFPAVRNKLTDTSITGLNDLVAPFGPADYSGATQWGTIALGALGGGDTLVGSVAIHITTRCKADYNESGALGVNDIFAFLTDWFAGCP